MDLFLENLYLYGCVYKEFNTHMGVVLEGLHPYESLEMGSHEPLEASGLKPLTYGCH